MKLLVTGAAGFIGSNHVRWLLAHRDDSVVAYDALTYAGNLDNLRDVWDDPRFTFVKGDIRDREAVRAAMAGCDGVVHFAAESHVDRSIIDPDAFVLTNCQGTNVVCDVARQLEVGRVLHISTDEVYGSVEEGSSLETDPLAAPLAVLGVEGGLGPDRAVLRDHLRAAGRGRPGRRTTTGPTSSPRRSSRCS